MKIGFIGCGVMGTAILKGIIKNGVAKKEDLIASDKYRGAAARVEEETGIQTTLNNIDVMEFADVIFLAIKPQFIGGVLDEIKESARPDQIFISIVPGKTLAWIGDHLGSNIKIVRTMPNTPAMVGEGMTALCVNENVTEEDRDLAIKLCNSFGKTELVPEHLLDVVTGISGSSPAYVFMFIEAMADAAVADGMPRKQAYKFAAQAVMGSAKLMLETGIHPGELKDMVCSPGGTTIQAVRFLEGKGFRSALIEAQIACVAKSREL